MFDDSSQFKGSVGAGVAIALGLHLLQILIVPVILSVAGSLGLLYSLMYWSVTQFLYLGPAAWIARRNGNTETMKGILIVAAVGVLLNGACDSVFLVPHGR